MFPMAFDRQILASLPLPGDEHRKRVLNVLQAMVARRIFPYFKRRRGTDAIVVARVSEHLAIRRLEDERACVEVMSLLIPEGEGWVIQIHERLFDYLAFVIPSDPESRLGDGTPEEGKMLALGVDAERGVGSVIPIQATRIRTGPGRKGEWRGPLSMVHATGNIERIMDESRKVATTRIFSCAEKLGIAIEHLQDPVHLHFMGGSTRKDGPSAGGSIALALASLLTGRRVRRDVAMTGEIDTQGRITADTLRVLASGGPDASILLIPPEARPELEERVGRAVRVREVVIRRERLSQVLGDILRSQPPPDFGKPAAVVAPFFLLRQDGILAERLAPESSLGPLRIFANNYTVQSVKIKASKGLLNRVYGHLAHLPREVLETCPFLGLRDGVHVVDLAFIPEKYRLDTQRAEKLLARCLARWLQVVEGVDP
jgi:hypothetical protein